MGEAPKLTLEESVAFAKCVMKAVNGKVPVIVGVSSPGFANMRQLTQAAINIGAAGVMVAPSGSLKTDEQILTYFGTVVETIGEYVPFVLQDFPLATNVVMSVSVIQKIIEQHASCVMLKHEDWPGLEKISKLRAADGMRPDFNIVRAWRTVPAIRDGARRRWRHDRIRLSGDVGSGRGAFERRQAARCT